MMINESDELKQELVSSYWAYIKARGKFFSEGVDRAGLVREIMRIDRLVAISEVKEAEQDFIEILEDENHIKETRKMLGGD